MKLSGKVAIITGASRGIGAVIAKEFAKEGCAVVIAAKTAEPNPRLPGTIFDVAREIEAQGGSALPIQTDVREVSQIEQMVKKTLEVYGRIDILINNAGALWWHPMLETPEKRFDLVMDVNARAAFFCTKSVLPTMIDQRSGHIVMMSPPIDFSVVPGKIAYFISKFGMTMTAHALAEEIREYGISVNALWPATVVESQATINFGLGDPSMWRKAEIMADATLALVTKPSGLITGQALIDEEVLRAEGITDFETYNCVPGATPLRITGYSGEATQPESPLTSFLHITKKT